MPGDQSEARELAAFLSERIGDPPGFAMITNTIVVLPMEESVRGSFEESEKLPARAGGSPWPG